MGAAIGGFAGVLAIVALLVWWSVREASVQKVDAKCVSGNGLACERCGQKEQMTTAAYPQQRRPRSMSLVKSGVLRLSEEVARLSLEIFGRYSRGPGWVVEIDH